jgi:hypothetical protein
LEEMEVAECEEWATTEQNLEKIRQNLFLLKLRYLQEKRENSIKTYLYIDSAP